MVPCELCKNLLGRPGYVPPHPKLLRSDNGAPRAERAGQQVFVYTCQHCRQVIALSTHDDGADYWTRPERAAR
ncbi:hypothetical protein [Cupriavidus agavae]|uniref:Uncharacterized protein n=1 Tax=Cupriavidus agavae TaxID=1001822 RepID=A0A4Q7RRL4_9BURK|nr:hypothetical protein [Cupriavidus agavae]RZT36331.1 hypothetical protein EV147_3650 [Cupriavidus agavae]